MIRPVTEADTARLMAVLDATGLFPGEMLGGMLRDHFASSAPAEHRWITFADPDPVAVAYYAP